MEQLYGGRDNQFDTKNALIDDRFLFGRDAILTTIGSAIKRDEHILISGLRKVGKTSLLNILRLQLADKPVCRWTWSCSTGTARNGRWSCSA